jgi:uncharacterized protein (DUF885 family)
MSLRRACALALFVCAMCLSTGLCFAQLRLEQPPAAPTAPVADRVRELHTIFQDYWQDKLKHEPEFATSLGDQRYADQLSDYSVTAYNARLERGMAFVQRLGTIDTTGMDEQDQLSKRMLVHDLVDQQEAEVCKPWQTPATQLDGPPADLPMLASMTTLSSVDDAEHYLARLKALPHVFFQISEDMDMGVEQHNTLPRLIAEKMQAQAAAMAAQKPEQTAFAVPLQHLPATLSATQQAQIRDEVLTAIRTQVQPAYARWAKFLSVIYIPAARTEPGLWAAPNGDACYAYLVRHNTTLDLTPAQIHQMGLAQVAVLEPQMLKLARSLGYADLPSFRAALAANPKEHAQSGAQLLDLYRHYETQMQAKLPTLFLHLPKEKWAVVAMDGADAADQVPADYEPGTVNGSRPGWIRINTYDAQKRLLTPVEAIAYHEGLPGHHLQLSLAQESTGLPEFRRYELYTAYVEGWALYSELLGKEAGFYTDPYSEYGRLENEMWRAVRLVVDTGVHSQHWTRAQMVDYFHQHTGLDDLTVQTEVDRYIAWPGQSLAYMTGQMEILKLRDEAQQALGSRFDLRAFHDEILNAGALPLNLLQERVEHWIAAQQPVSAQASVAAPQLQPVAARAPRAASR